MNQPGWLYTSVTVSDPPHTTIQSLPSLVRYNAEAGAYVDLGILDVQQIFGRAGRPQFDKFGEATLITSHDRLSHFLSRIMDQLPIESRFISRMTDNLNAEIGACMLVCVHAGVRACLFMHVCAACAPVCGLTCTLMPLYMY